MSIDWGQEKDTPPTQADQLQAAHQEIQLLHDIEKDLILFVLDALPDAITDQSYSSFLKQTVQFKCLYSLQTT